MKLLKLTLFLGLLTTQLLAVEFSPRPIDSLNSLETVKTEIIRIAEFYKGQGDPDFKIQNTLQPYVDKLIEIAPKEYTENLSSRVEFLAGRWQQVWGPYEYRKKGRIVNPQTDPENIYQVIFKSTDNSGFYYNVGPNNNKKTGDFENTGLLRGEYKIVSKDTIKVRFTKLSRIDGLPPADLTYTDLPELSEANTLEGEKTVLWSWFVKLTFGGGFLNEIYTDEDLRITYGKNDSVFKDPYLYVLVRAK